MKTNRGGMPAPIKSALADIDFTDAIRRYVRTYVVLHGLGKRPKLSAYPVTLCGVSWNGGNWAAQCPAPSWAMWERSQKPWQLPRIS